jgi:hypothetical protein
VWERASRSRQVLANYFSSLFIWIQQQQSDSQTVFKSSQQCIYYFGVLLSTVRIPPAPRCPLLAGTLPWVDTHTTTPRPRTKEANTRHARQNEKERARTPCATTFSPRSTRSTPRLFRPQPPPSLNSEAQEIAAFVRSAGSPPAHKDKMRYRGRRAVVIYCSKHCAEDDCPMHKLVCASSRTARARHSTRRPRSARRSQTRFQPDES